MGTARELQCSHHPLKHRGWFLRAGLYFFFGGGEGCDDVFEVLDDDWDVFWCRFFMLVLCGACMIFPFLCSLCVYLLIPFSFFIFWLGMCVCCRYELFFLTMVSSFCIYPLSSNSVKHKWFKFCFVCYCIHVHWNLNSSVDCNSCVTLIEFFILTGHHCIRFDCTCTCCLNLYASLKIFFSGLCFNYACTVLFLWPDFHHIQQTAHRLQIVDLRPVNVCWMTWTDMDLKHWGLGIVEVHA